MSISPLRFYMALSLVSALGCQVGKNVSRTTGTSGSAEEDSGDGSSDPSNDSSAPVAPGAALAMTANSSSPFSVELTWSSAASDAESGISKQEVLLYADDSSCSGSADKTLNAGANAKAYTWNRYSAPLRGEIRFRVKATNGAGLVTMSDCSASISFSSYTIPKQGSFDDQGLYILRNADVNGDGIDDIVSANSTGNGTVSVVLGGAANWGSNTYLFTGDGTNNYVSDLYAIDIDGSGGVEIIFADSSYDSNKGAIFVIKWSSSFSSTQTITSSYHRRYVGDATTDGTTLAGYIAFADVTGDGINDIIASSSTASTDTYTMNGLICVMPGGSTLPASGDWSTVGGRRYHGDENQAYLGLQYDSLYYDITGDNIIDIIAYDPDGQEAGNNDGAVYIIPGAASLPATAVITTAGRKYWGDNANADQFLADGLAVGDFDGDGTDDLFLSDREYQATNIGAIFVIMGSGSLPASAMITTAANYTYTGTTSQDDFGDNLIVTDVTGDGRADILSGNDAAVTGAGVFYALAGAGTPPATNDVVTAGGSRIVGNAGEGFGEDLFAADITGDGVEDVVVQTETTKVWAFKGGSIPATGNANSVGTMYSLPAGVGLNSCEAGDVTGDGVDEFVCKSLGAIGVLYKSGSDLPAAGALDTVGRVYTGVSSEPYGYNVVLTDMNGDGTKDIASTSWSGSFAADPGGRTDAGSFYLVPGGSTLPASGTIATTGIRVDGDTASDAIQASSPIGAYDYNEDGYEDVIVYTTTGIFYLVYGNSDINAIDKTVIMDSSIGLESYSVGNLKAIDITGNGSIDIGFSLFGADLSGLTNNGVIEFIPSTMLPSP